MAPTDRTATVLIVDDEQNLTTLYAAWLEPDYDVVTATSGSEAVTELDSDVDVALLDRRMPETSGDEC